MEFRFNLNEVLGEPIVEIGNSLIPPGFAGDKRALWDTQAKITQIVNAMGEASASAQGLSKPITTADRLRNSEHKLFLLVDQSANSGKGAVTGMLKVGEKGLYVFDREGQHYQVSPPCVLDFYIHESRQRSGYGKALFEHMLQKQQVEPVKMAIDRPSDKLLGFLNKHYGLNSPVKQMNNYVVYDGFFPKPSENSRTLDGDKSYTPSKKLSANGLQSGIPNSPYGRYGAPRPLCSMGQIIHNDSAVIKRNQEPTGVRSEPISNAQGQRNMYSSNQAPVWQATQSVPNMHYVYSQNPQQHGPNQQYPQNPQYAQYQQFVQNTNVQYPPSSGDYVVNATPQQMRQPVEQNQMAVAQVPNQASLDQYNQHAAQNYPPTYYNYALGQGDATNQSYKDQTVIASTAQQAHGQNVDQIQYQQMPNTNEAQAPQPVAQNNTTAQSQPQVFTYQGQNYCYNPQTQQYQIIPNENQQMYHAREDVPKSYQPAQAVPYSQQITHQSQKEPLQPQNLDGTVRRVQQSVSMPVQKAGLQDKQNLPVMVQETASAPIGYHQHQPSMASHQYSAGLSQAYNTTSIPQMLNQNQAHQQQIANQVTPHQSMTENQSVHAMSGLPSGDSQNVANMGQAPQDTTLRPHNVMMPQLTSNAPVASNVNQSFENQGPNQSIQHVQQAQPATNTQQENVAYNEANLHVTPQNQRVSQAPMMTQSGDQNLGMHQHFQNVAPVMQSTNSINNNNIVPPQMAYPNTSQVMTQPIGASSPLNNQIAVQNQQMHQNGQQVLAMPQAPNVLLQQHQQQEQMMYSRQYIDHQVTSLANQQPAINVTENGTAGRLQRAGNHGLDQDDNRIIQNEPVASQSAHNDVSQETRHVRQEQEFDLSKGYPPQHHEKPAQNSTPKADRPQSLNIEPVEDLEQKGNEANAEIHEQPLDGDREDSLDGELASLEGIEEEIERIEVAPNESTHVLAAFNSPDVEAAGIITPGRSTPGLTDQGYFDLKFYHSKLW